MVWAFAGCCSVLALSSAIVAGCSGAPVAQTTTAIIVVQCPQPFTATLDERPVPVIRSATGAVIRVPAGQRRLVLEAVGYLPFLTDLDVIAGETYELTLELWPAVPELDTSW
jgi:hypothetical protein